MTNLEIAQTIRLGLFVDRATVKEAWDYAYDTKIFVNVR